MIHKDLNKKESGAEMHIEWLSRLKEIENLKERWLKLESSVNNRTVFSCLDYAIPWYRHYSGTSGERYGKPLLGLAWQGSELVGIAPLAIWDGTLGKVPVRRIDSVGHNAESGEFLVQDGRDDIIGDFIDSLFSKVDFDVLCLNGFDPGSGKFNSLLQSITAHNLKIETMDYRYAMVDLREGYEEYCNSKSRNFRRNLRQQAKRIASAGTIRIDRISSFGAYHEIPEYLARIFSIGDRSWKADVNVIPGEHHRRFTQDVVTRFAKRGMIDISILKINDIDAAYILAIVERGIFYDFTISFDDRFRNLYPGVYLMQEILRILPNLGIHSVVSHGDHEYKQRWATEFVAQNRIFIFSFGLKARVSRLARFILPRALAQVRKHILRLPR